MLFGNLQPQASSFALHSLSFYDPLTLILSCEMLNPLRLLVHIFSLRSSLPYLFFINLTTLSPDRIQSTTDKNLHIFMNLLFSIKEKRDQGLLCSASGLFA